MWTLFSASLLLGLSLQLAQSAVRRQKVWMPEQLAFREKSKAYDAKVERLRAAATTAYQAEAAREQIRPCPNADNTLAINQCLAHEDDLTGSNYKAFTTALRGILALPQPRGPGQPAIIVGPSGPEGTPATNIAAFDKAEGSWHLYADAECEAVDTLSRGGTGVNAADLECSLRLARARLHELDTTYEADLGHR